MTLQDMKTNLNKGINETVQSPTPPKAGPACGDSGATKAQGTIDGSISDEQKPFVKKNYLFMGIALLMIIVGFLLMTGSSNAIDAKVFNEDIFSTRRIVVGPMIAFLGFVAMAFAILYSPKQKEA